MTQTTNQSFMVKTKFHQSMITVCDKLVLHIFYALCVCLVLCCVVLCVCVCLFVFALAATPKLLRHPLVARIISILRSLLLDHTPYASYASYASSHHRHVVLTNTDTRSTKMTEKVNTGCRTPDRSSNVDQGQTPERFSRAHRDETEIGRAHV